MLKCLIMCSLIVFVHTRKLYFTNNEFLPHVEAQDLVYALFFGSSFKEEGDSGSLAGGRHGLFICSAVGLELSSC